MSCPCWHFILHQIKPLTFRTRSEPTLLLCRIMAQANIISCHLFWIFSILLSDFLLCLSSWTLAVCPSEACFQVAPRCMKPVRTTQWELRQVHNGTRTRCRIQRIHWALSWFSQVQHAKLRQLGKYWVSENFGLSIMKLWAILASKEPDDGGQEGEKIGGRRGNLPLLPI